MDDRKTTLSQFAVSVALREEVRDVARGLLGLSDEIARVAPEPSAALRAVCERTTLADPTGEITLAIVGPVGTGKRTLINALLGARVLPEGSAWRTAPLVSVAAAPDLRATATFDDRTSTDLLGQLPDRNPAFDKARDRAEAEIRDAEAARRALTDRIDRAHHEVATAVSAIAGVVRAEDEAEDATRQADARLARALTAEGDAAAAARRPASDLPSFLGTAPPRWAIWLWLLRILLAPFYRGPLAALAARVARHDEARVKLVAARQAVDTARTRIGVAERRRTDEERHAELLRTLDAMEEERRVADERLDRLRVQLVRVEAERTRYDSERTAELLRALRELAAGERHARAVAELDLAYPAANLAPAVRLLLLPEPSHATPEALAPRPIHACLIVADAADGLDDETMGRLDDLRRFVPGGLVALTRIDRTHDADEARRRAVARFADAIDRDPERVPSFAFAAELALGADASADTASMLFAEEAERLFELLAAERNVIVPARGALELRDAIAAVDRRAAQEERLRVERLAKLEAARAPAPQSFHAQYLERSRVEVERAAEAIVTDAIVLLRHEFTAMNDEWQKQVLSVSGSAATRACVQAIEREAAPRVAAAFDRVDVQIHDALRRAGDALESRSREDVRGRYGLTKAARPPPSLIIAEPVDDAPFALELRFEPAFVAFQRARWVYAAGGAAAGAGAGAVAASAMWAAIGGLIGLGAAWVKRPSSLRSACAEVLGGAMAEGLARGERALAARKNDLATALLEVIDEAVAGELERIASWVTRLMLSDRAQAEAEEAERARAATLRATLRDCDDRLGRLLEIARREGRSLWL